MEAGEIGGALLFAVAAAVAVSVGAVDFSRPLTAGAPLDFQGAVSWLIGILDGTSSAAADVYGAWVAVRGGVIAPVLQVAVWACMVMLVMLVVEAGYNSVVSLGVKAIGWRPEWEVQVEAPRRRRRGEGERPLPYGPGPDTHVYKLSIAAACELQWPKDRIIVQVLDDSTDPFIKNLVELECEHWANKGVNIKYATRTSRKGFKAGALKKGMECDYARQSEYVAIFDADFQPEPDFLLRTVPFLLHNPEVALVQARWSFVNHTTSLLTRVQKMFYDYHFKVEQEAGSATFAFFSFNGTAGVWLTVAITDAGGWKDRTTVEDMDLVVRATLKGWKFVYVGDVRVKSELPSTYKAYCRQQSGGLVVVQTYSDISLVKKFYMLYSFFFVRRVVAPVAACIFYNIIIPISVAVPELYLPVWGVAYIPMVLTIVTAIRHPKNLHIMPFWILFESVMTLHRMRAALTGLLELEGFNQWIVTKKVGNDLEDTDVP
ncbi:hypothetical protein U9M48_032377 [Paspalum notatum var. saurae]|uniref:glucomannan 4-beta-mannosyltransferase n=1 Tax=Paspalum notatum var. saurae TaxID=547442 RepID=A0AAQ3U761_PASNO